MPRILGRRSLAWVVLLLPLSAGASCSRDGEEAPLVIRGSAGAAGECGTGETDCGGSCVDTDSDRDHCGECGARCEPSAGCVDGECVCRYGLLECDAGCRDPRTDPKNCGECGRECGDGESCRLGECACPDGQESCGDRCVPEGDCESTTTAGGMGGMGGEGGSPASSTSEGGAGAGSDVTTSTSGGDQCVITALDELSTAIATVGIVTFSATNIAIHKAEIEFTRATGGPVYVAPVDLDEPDHRTLLLGMKGETDYEYRIILNDGECMSPTRTITTGPVATTVPVVTKERPMPEAAAPGFVVTSGGIGNAGRDTPAFILDSDGDVVWWATAPSQCSRAKMDWEGTHMIMMALNVRYNPTGGTVRRVSMDGLRVEPQLSGLTGAHHDFTVTPGGNIVAIVHQNSCSGVLERTPTGAIRTIVADVHALYQPVGDCHPNSIHYYAKDDSFTISDRNPNLFVKISRSGALEWQFGGKDPIASLHYQGTWTVNHGHDLLPNGNFLFFNNGGNVRQSPVLEFELTEPEATLVWKYTADFASPTLGDVQRLPNGNTLIAYSNAGVLREVNRDGELVQQYTLPSVGYIEHRPTLYGPPPR